MTIHYETLPSGDVRVTWPDAEELLGRPHEGMPADDERMVAALLAAGAPAWVRGADGYIDEDGWYLCAPESEVAP